MGQSATFTYEPELSSSNPYDVLARNPFFSDKKEGVLLEICSTEQRVSDFEPYERVMNEKEAVSESARCLGCGCGEGCQHCKTICCEFAPEIVGVDVVGIRQDECVAYGMCFNLCPNKNIDMVCSE